jgi:hypothetical protein
VVAGPYDGEEVLGRSYEVAVLPCGEAGAEADYPYDVAAAYVQPYNEADEEARVHHYAFRPWPYVDDEVEAASVLPFPFPYLFADQEEAQHSCFS